MKRTERIEKSKLVIEEFTSFTELLNTCDERTIKSDVDDPARLRNNEDFSGVKSYEEARELLQYGQEKHLETIKTGIKNLEKQQVANKMAFYNDIVGYAPIVPNALRGLPNSMFNQNLEPKKNKVITVLYDVTNPSHREVSEIAEYGAKFVAYVMNLEKQGYRVKIDAMASFNHSLHGNGDCYVMRVPIKNEFNPIDLKRISFPLTHSAMLRSIGFDWYERCPDIGFDCGYGFALCIFSKDNRKEVLKKILNKNEYYVMYGLDLDEVFKDVR